MLLLGPLVEERSNFILINFTVKVDEIALPARDLWASQLDSSSVLAAEELNQSAVAAENNVFFYCYCHVRRADSRYCMVVANTEVQAGKELTRKEG
jgi:hypothetical protein